MNDLKNIMNLQTFDPWKHSELPESCQVDFESIQFNSDGLVINLKKKNGNGQGWALLFTELPLAFRVANESERLKALNYLPKNNKHSFYTVKNSEFIDWLNSETLDIRKADPVLHLAIVTDEWIDVIISTKSVCKFTAT